MKSMQRSIVALLVVGALSLGLTGSATAQIAVQDGLVNVNLADIFILNDLNIGIAAQVAANVCGVKVGPVAVLATQVDAGGPIATVCTTDQGPITIEQNQ